MNFELYIAKKIALKGEKTFSKLIIRIAIAAISLSLTTMIIALAVLSGFQTEIRDKVIGFGSHIQISKFNTNNSYESSPIKKDQALYDILDTIQGIKHIQVFATKPGIIKTDEEIEGVLLKGISNDFDWDFFSQNIIEGRAIEFKKGEKSKDILISKFIASKLKIRVDDGLLMYFVQDPPRVRKFKVSGIYETGLEELDKLFVLADLAHIQKLNDWKEDQIGGYEVLINDYDQLEKLGNKIHSHIGLDLKATTIKEVFSALFDWLALQDINVQVILTLMILVASINMITALLVLILERTNMVGTLKALGASNWCIRKIFLYNAAYLIGTGVLIGNVVGLGLCIMQQQFGFITLPQESYYVSVVPIKLELLPLLILNSGTLIVCILMLIIPSYIITKISPVKAIKFG